MRRLLMPTNQEVRKLITEAKVPYYCPSCNGRLGFNLESHLKQIDQGVFDFVVALHPDNTAICQNDQCQLTYSLNDLQTNHVATSSEDE